MRKTFQIRIGPGWPNRSREGTTSLSRSNVSEGDVLQDLPAVEDGRHVPWLPQGGKLQKSLLLVSARGTDFFSNRKLQSPPPQEADQKKPGLGPGDGYCRLAKVEIPFALPRNNAHPTRWSLPPSSSTRGPIASTCGQHHLLRVRGKINERGVCGGSLRPSSRGGWGCVQTLSLRALESSASQRLPYVKSVDSRERTPVTGSPGKPRRT